MENLNKKKHYYLVIDTETANGLDEPLVYDFGFLITDKEGNIYHEANYIIYDIYAKEKELMKTAYYAEKIPQYEINLKNNNLKMLRFSSLKAIITKILTEYNIKKVWAFNALFDIKALNNTMKFTSNGKYKYFFPYGTNIGCIWATACQTICLQRKYFKFIEEHDLFTTKGIKTSAEVVYRFLTSNDFIESHTALDDCKIEKDILIECFKKHKKMTTFARPFPSQIVAKEYNSWKKRE